MLKLAFTNLSCSISLALLMLIINESNLVNCFGGHHHGMHGMHGHHGMMPMGPPPGMHGMHGMHGHHGMMPMGPPPGMGGGMPMGGGGGGGGGGGEVAAEKRQIDSTLDQAMVKRNTKMIKRHFGPPGGMHGMPPFPPMGGPPHGMPPFPHMGGGPPHGMTMGPPPGMGGGGGGGGEGGGEAAAE